MNNDNTLIPKYRFPEFKDDDSWEIKELKEISNITNGNANVQDHIENGKYPLFDRSAIIKSSNSYLFDGEAVIIPGEGMRFVPKYYIGKYNLHQRAYALQEFSVNSKYVFYSLFYKQDLIAQKAVQSTVLSLRLPILQNFEIELPLNPAEQKKIAACLSSLDDVIAGHEEKLTALEEHKKGLMQSLFPQEGETRPKYRFPEFENDGDWVEKKLGDVTDYSNGRAHEQEIDLNGKFVVVNSKFISSDGNVVKYSNAANCLASKNDILMVLSDVPNGKAIAKCHLVEIDDKYTVNQRVCKLTPKSDIDARILYYITNRNKYFLGFDDGVQQTNLRNEDVLNFVFLLPKKLIEQQKIASVLSSVDELIVAQREKIEALKAHKKGLMQGLFPKLEA